MFYLCQKSLEQCGHTFWENIQELDGGDLGAIFLRSWLNSGQRQLLINLKDAHVEWKLQFKCWVEEIFKKRKNKTEMLAVSQSGNVSQFLTELIKRQRSCGKEVAALWEINQRKPWCWHWDFSNYHNYAAATFLEVILHIKSNIFMFTTISAWFSKITTWLPPQGLCWMNKFE